MQSNPFSFERATASPSLSQIAVQVNKSVILNKKIIFRSLSANYGEATDSF